MISEKLRKDFLSVILTLPVELTDLGYVFQRTSTHVIPTESGPKQVIAAEIQSLEAERILQISISEDGDPLTTQISKFNHRSPTVSFSVSRYLEKRGKDSLAETYWNALTLQAYWPLMLQILTTELGSVLSGETWIDVDPEWYDY